MTDRVDHSADKAWVYLLQCHDGSLYVGSTTDLDHRMTQHAAGGAGSYTSSRHPVRLVWQLETEHIADAWKIETQLKGWRRAKKIALIEARLQDLPALARTAANRDPEVAEGGAGHPSTSSGR